MSVCPVCKAPIRSAASPCPQCGRAAAPAVPDLAPAAPVAFDDELDLVSGSNVHEGHGQASAYETSGMSGFDAFDDDDASTAGHALELDMPMPPPPEPPPASMRQGPAPASAPAPPPIDDAPSLSVSMPVPVAPPPSKPDPAAIIARYPAAPEKIWQMPIYACKVLYRQFELRMDLTALRRRRSPDVPLYERALEVYEPRTFRIGLLVTCVLAALATFVFFLPVILRFARAPD